MSEVNHFMVDLVDIGTFCYCTGTLMNEFVLVIQSVLICFRYSSCRLCLPIPMHISKYFFSAYFGIEVTYDVSPIMFLIKGCLLLFLEVVLHSSSSFLVKLHTGGRICPSVALRRPSRLPKFITSL